MGCQPSSTLQLSATFTCVCVPFFLGHSLQSEVSFSNCMLSWDIPGFHGWLVFNTGLIIYHYMLLIRPRYPRISDSQIFMYIYIYMCNFVPGHPGMSAILHTTAGSQVYVFFLSWGHPRISWDVTHPPNAA